MANCLTLIRQLRNPFVLDGRYADLQVVNRDPATGQPIGRGNFSVVFRAIDVTNGQQVAVKFFDPDFLGISYRPDSFVRECDLLDRLQGDDRCLQKIEPLKNFPLTVTDPASGATVTVPCSYFVIEWLDEDIDDFVYKTHDPVQKLRLFRGVVLAVSALHSRGLAHRDLKPDNLRITDRRGRQTVVAIDLGTTVATDSPHVGVPLVYSSPVGHMGYAPLEARCGLSGIRGLGPLSDWHAVGCILFELFNIDHYRDHLWSDQGYRNCYTDCHHYIAGLKLPFDDGKTLTAEWRKAIKQLKAQVTLPSIDLPGSTVPLAVRDVLDELVKGMTATDFDDRLVDPELILRRVDSVIAILSNAKSEAHAREQRRLYRARRDEKLRRRRERLEALLARQER